MPGRNTWKHQTTTGNEPGDHLETSSISQGKRPGAHNSRTTRRTDARGTPGDHDHGQNKHQGATPGDISHKPGTNKHQGEHLETSSQERASQGATWSASAISQERTSQGATPGDISHKPGTNKHQGEHLETSSQERASQGATWRHQP